METQSRRESEKPFHNILYKAMWNFTIVYAMLCVAGLVAQYIRSGYEIL